MNSSSRRRFVKEAMTGIGFVTMPSLGFSEKLSRPLNIVCVGAHPDDPESGCGATLAKFVAAGHAVTIIYLTRGEAGIAGKSKEEAAAIRSKEAIEACTLLKAKPVFAGQIDGDTVVNNEWVKKIQDLIGLEKPDIVFTHWPLDSHKDTQELKRKAVYCHVSQDPPGIYNCGHTAMEQFRGLEMGVPAAEGFVRMTGKEKGNYFNF